MKRQSFADAAIGWRFVASAVILLMATFAFQALAQTEEIYETLDQTTSEVFPADFLIPEEVDIAPSTITLLESESPTTPEVIEDETVEEEVAPEEPIVESATVILAQEPEVLPEKEDYQPGQTATIFGRFFTPLETFLIRVFGSDENNQNYTETEEEIATDEEGSFTFNYLLDSLYRPFYEVVVSTLSGEKLAETWFRDSSVQIYNQCSNDDGDGYALGDTECRWINGAINPNNSTYFEGDSTIHRTFINGFAPGTSHTVTFKYGTTKGGNHAYDYLTNYNASENSSVTDRCQDIVGCATAVEDTEAMEMDPNVPDTIEPSAASRLFTARGATITDVSVPTIVSGSYAGDSETVVTVTFTVGPSNGSMCETNKVQGQDVTTCGIAMWFGAHIAETAAWTAYDGTTGAGAINGAPYHVALASVDNAEQTQGGGRDNQMQADAIEVLSSITIIKDAVPNDAQDFSFTTSGTGLSNFSLDDDANGTLSNTQTFNGLSAGTYSITEGTVAGWSLTNLACVDPTTNSTINLGTRTASINLAAGENVTCTFTNTLQQGTLTLVKTVTNDNGGTAATTDWTLSAAGPTPISGTSGSGAVTSAAVNAGVYTLSESTGPAGYTAGSWSCSGATANGSQVTVPAGGNVTCTINNNDNQAYVTVTKVVTNDNGGNAQPNDFALKLEGNAVTSGVQVPVNPGTYTASETLLSGYTFEGFTGDCDVNGDVTVALGESKSCTLTNNDQQAYITVTKIVNNDYGGTAVPNDFALKLEGNAVSSGVQVPVNPGTYTASENLVNGYAFDGFSGDCDVNGDVTVALGQAKTCILTNSDIQPKLKLVKTVNNQYGGTAVAGDFQASVGGNDVDWDVFVGLNDGNYDANETGLSGYEAGDWGEDCATDGAVTLAIGETKTCTITNSDLPAEIHGMKFEDMNGNGVKDVSDNGLQTWTIFLDTNGNGDLDGGEPSTTTDVNGHYSFIGLSVGTYKVREVQQAGWTQTTANPTDIALENGEKAENVNFGNFKLVSITGKKFNDDEGDGSIAGDPTLSGWTIRLYNTATNPWTLVAATTTNGSGSYAFNNLGVGSYKVCEVLQAGWIQTFASIQGTNTSPNSASEGQWCNTKSVTTSGNNPSAGNFGNYEIKALTVEKTAATTFTRTHEWEITKTVDDDSVDIFTGDSQTVYYDVEVEKTGYTDSAWNVTGSITITNPNQHASLVANITTVTDEISDQGAATVDCPGGLPQNLAAGATLVCTYSKAVSVGVDEINTATVSTTGLVPGGSDNADVDFGDPTTVVDDKINVTDTYGGDLGETSISTTFEYDRPLTCGGEQGQYKGLGNKVPNTATITETSQSDDEEVTVNCYDLTVAKTANTSYTKTWTWDIDKTSTTTTLNLAPGQIHPVYYEVTVTAAPQNSDYAAAGTITITNPAPIAAPISGVTDILTGNVAATVDCGGATSVPANNSIECSYEVDLTNADTLTNTAEVTMTNGSKYSGTAEVNFVGATVTEIDESIDVTDDKKGPLGTVLASAVPKTFKYVLDVGPYEVTSCGTTQKYDNTAELTTNDTSTTDSDMWTVDANIRCTCSLTQGYWKTHNDTFHGGAPTDDNWENVAPNAELTGFFTTNLANTYPYAGPNAATATWYTVFWTAPKGNVYYNLAHQYMAAKLNVLNGAYGTTVTADIAAAEALFKIYTPAQIGAMKGKKATDTSKLFNTLAGKLGAFNEGITNPAGHCTEIPQ